MTIVRPSQTYGNDRLPLSVKGKSCWSVISRIQRGKPVIVHGDGKTIWHMMHTFDFAKQYSNLYDDDTLAQLIPDYICRIDYRQGIYMYLKYMDENPQLKIEDEEFDQWCDGVLRSYAEFCRKFKEKF